MSKRIINILAVILVPALAARPEPPPALVIGVTSGPVSLDLRRPATSVTASILSNTYEGRKATNPDERTGVHPPP